MEDTAYREGVKLSCRRSVIHSIVYPVESPCQGERGLEREIILPNCQMCWWMTNVASTPHSFALHDSFMSVNVRESHFIPNVYHPRNLDWTYRPERL